MLFAIDGDVKNDREWKGELKEVRDSQLIGSLSLLTTCVESDCIIAVEREALAFILKDQCLNPYFRLCKSKPQR